MGASEWRRGEGWGLRVGLPLWGPAPPAPDHSASPGGLPRPPFRCAALRGAWLAARGPGPRGRGAAGHLAWGVRSQVSPAWSEDSGRGAPTGIHEAAQSGCQHQDSHARSLPLSPVPSAARSEGHEAQGAAWVPTAAPASWVAPARPWLEAGWAQTSAWRSLQPGVSGHGGRWSHPT